MKKIYVVFLLASLLFALSGCGKEVKQQVVPVVGNEGMINIYYPADNMVQRDEEPYQIKQTDSVSASVEEVMSALAVKLQEHMTYYTYMLDVDNNVSLEFALIDEVGDEYLLMANAAIAKTLFQVNGINGVGINISDSKGRMISEKLYRADSFYFYDYDDTSLNKRRVKLYFANEASTGLTSGYFLLSTAANTSLQESIVKALALRNDIPSGTKVNAVAVSDGICYLDLSHEFADENINVNGSIPLYAVVNSITNLSGIDKVQILIDGEIVSKYRGTNQIDIPISFNHEMIQ